MFRNLSRSNIRILSNLSSRFQPKTTTAHESKDVPEDKNDTEISVRQGVDDADVVPEAPIKGLNLVSRITKVKKTGSFSVDLFCGSYDDDFLTYPDVLEDRKENIALKEQSKMIQQLWPQIWDDKKFLQKFNFFNLYQLSVSEMMTVFEAIGAASRKCFEVKLPAVGNYDASSQQQVLISKSILSLVIRNCLTYWPIYNSENQSLKQILPKKHIIFGQPQDIVDLFPPIGFCWAEHPPELGSVPPQEWLTLGKNDGSNNYLIQGKKSKIFYENNVENYLVFYRDYHLSELYKSNVPKDEPNPASDPLVGCIVVPKSEINLGPVYSDSAGFQYHDAEIDALVPSSQSVFEARRNDPKAVNIKGLGQIAICSVILGMLKDSLRSTYTYLTESRIGLLNCDIVERKLAEVTSKIFAIESMIYYIAGMYDGLEEGFDAHLEAAMVKIVTNEYAFDSLRLLQQVCGSEMFIISKLLDQINIFDSFLDGNIHNRLYLGTMGVLWFARNKNVHLNQLRLAPWYPGYFVRNMLRERTERSDLLTLQADIRGNLHPSLDEAAVNLEYILKRVKYAAEGMCLQHGKDVTAAQTCLYKLSQLAIDSFMLTTICARASKSYCNGSRNAEIDVAMATDFSRSLHDKTKIAINDIHTFGSTPILYKSKIISELNQKWGGYYAESPLDPNM